MAECKICNLIKSNELKQIYADAKMVAVLCPEPVSKGHVWVMPKKHSPIMEQIADFDIADLFSLANKISVSLFEVLQAQGTNIFVQNGVEAGQKFNHFMINIIPRQPDDVINLELQPRQLTEEEMSTVELKIKEQTKQIGEFKEEKPDPLNLDKQIEEEPEEDNFFSNHLRRIP